MSYLFYTRVKRLKVFISWSGGRSHKVATALRDWMQNVIQAIEPYVSSEDIQKGARWSSDVAQELQDSTFGILCVTKDNLTAPWLLFEAGALSKTIETSSVVPFLFDIKPSDLTGSPLLQFQATDCTKDDLKKLLQTLNNVCGAQGLTESRLDSAFEHWYPDLEAELNKIKSETSDKTEEAPNVDVAESSEILEEILDVSRTNQRLLRNPDVKTFESIEILASKIDDFTAQTGKVLDIERRRIGRKIHPMMIEEMIHFGRNEKSNLYAFLMILSLYKNDFPWIYDLGKELVDVLKSDVSRSDKQSAVSSFRDMLEFTSHYQEKFDMYNGKKEYFMYAKELPYILMKYFDDFLIENEI